MSSPESERTITAVELILEDLARVLLGLLGGVGILEVGLVAAGDLSISRHVENLVVDRWGDGDVGKLSGCGCGLTRFRMSSLVLIYIPEVHPRIIEPLGRFKRD